MRALIVLAFLAVLAMAISSPSTGEDYLIAEGGPGLSASHSGGSLECGRAELILIDILNSGNISLKAVRAPEDEGEAALAGLESEYEAGSSTALGIEAELMSSDGRVDVLSGPQVAGSLGPGESRRVRFLARADEDLDAGIYRFSLVLRCARQSNVQVSGDPGFPYISFQYENLSESIPLEVTAALGPKVEVSDVKGDAPPGYESALEIVLTNRGDQPASGLVVEARDQMPLYVTSGPAYIDILKQGESASAKLSIEVDGGAEPGEYALPFDMRYMDGDQLRTEKAAALVQAKRSAALRLQIRPVLMVLISVFIATVIYIGVRSGLGGRLKGGLGRRRRL